MGLGSRCSAESPYHKVLPLQQLSFTDRLRAVESRMRLAVERAGRKRSDVKLVAVSKKFSAEAIRRAYDSGLRDFGENYVQEFAQKQPALADLRDARFDLIGHLQSNKARLASQLFRVIQTVDSVKTLERLDAAATEGKRPLEILLEIKLSDEPAKTGASPEQIPDLILTASRCRSLTLTGLMTIPPWSKDAELSRPYFQQLAQFGQQYGLPELSMGMSDDFEVAIEEGATIIRVGTALFGPRPKPLPAEATPSIS